MFLLFEGEIENLNITIIKIWIQCEQVLTIQNNLMLLFVWKSSFSELSLKWRQITCYLIRMKFILLVIHCIRRINFWNSSFLKIQLVTNLYMHCGGNIKVSNFISLIILWAIQKADTNGNAWADQRLYNVVMADSISLTGSAKLIGSCIPVNFTVL